MTPAVTLTERLCSREFYELMQAYRHTPVEKPYDVSMRYEAVKAWLRAAPAAPPAEAKVEAMAKLLEELARECSHRTLKVALTEAAAMLRTLAAERDAWREVAEMRAVSETDARQKQREAEQRADSLADEREEVERELTDAHAKLALAAESEAGDGELIRTLTERAERAEALLEAERKDAGRYRFIRQYAQNVTAGLVDWMSPDFAGGDMGTLDAAIDAAQKEPK